MKNYEYQEKEVLNIAGYGIYKIKRRFDLIIFMKTRFLKHYRGRIKKTQNFQDSGFYKFKDLDFNKVIRLLLKYGYIVDSNTTSELHPVSYGDNILLEI